MAVSGGNKVRLENDYKDLRRTFDGEERVEIRAIGTAPFSKYLIVFKMPSLRLNSQGQPIKVEQTVVELTLPAGYPRVPPIAKTVAGDIVFHPNFNASKICLMDEWSPSVQLADLVREIAAMLQWQKYNIRSPLNAEAAEWSQRHQNEIPLSNYDVGGAAVEIEIK